MQSLLELDPMKFLRVHLAGQIEVGAAQRRGHEIQLVTLTTSADHIAKHRDDIILNGVGDGFLHVKYDRTEHQTKICSRENKTMKTKAWKKIWKKFFMFSSHIPSTTHLPGHDINQKHAWQKQQRKTQSCLKCVL